MTYRNSSGEGVYKFVKESANVIYDQYAPYSYKAMRDKIKELGLEYTNRQYTIQIATFAGIAAAPYCANVFTPSAKVKCFAL